jgi:hypothetical protein
MSPPEGRANTADILLIGAQRAMTTWAHRLAVMHPRAWAFPDFSPLTTWGKEARFWPRNRSRGLDWYRVLMTPPEGRAHRLSLDFTPDYALMSASEIAECRRLSPSARVIYILRDPLARALSALRMHSMWEHDTTDPARLRLEPDAALRARAEAARLWDHCDYAANAARWQAEYPDMTVLNAEDLAADPVAGAERLLAAMGLDPTSIPPAHRPDFEARARDRVWVTPHFAASPELLAWLHGATWHTRARTREAFGFDFAEGSTLLAAAGMPDA